VKTKQSWPAPKKIHKRPNSKGTIGLNEHPKIKEKTCKSLQEVAEKLHTSSNRSYIPTSRERGKQRAIQQQEKLTDPNIGKPPSLCIKSTTRERVEKT
jgi:hypothetical protein